MATDIHSKLLDCRRIFRRRLVRTAGFQLRYNPLLISESDELSHHLGGGPGSQIIASFQGRLNEAGMPILQSEFA
jgi:hypothetical protein